MDSSILIRPDIGPGLNNIDSMTTPCSVSTCGGFLRPQRPFFDIDLRYQTYYLLRAQQDCFRAACLRPILDTFLTLGEPFRLPVAARSAVAFEATQLHIQANEDLTHAAGAKAHQGTREEVMEGACD